MTAVWQAMLGIPRVGIHDDFFELGGTSILITQILSRLSQEFCLDLPPLSLLDSPTPAGLAQYLDGMLGIERSMTGTSK